MVDGETWSSSKVPILKSSLIFVTFLGLLFLIGTPKSNLREGVVATFLADGGFGDSKFVFSSKRPPGIVTTRFGKLFWIELPADPKYPPVLEPLSIEGDWFAVEQDHEGSWFILTSSQAQRSLRLYSVERVQEKKTHLVKVVVEDDNLKIDPTLKYFKGRWFLTFTQVDGTANRSTKDSPNGTYAIKFMSSADLKSWDGPYTVIQRDSNLEDPILFAHSEDERLTLLYEQETLDRHESALSLISSQDLGRTWTDQRLLHLPPGDNEPAGLFKLGNHYHLFFSSDAETPGTSYEGSYAYQAPLLETNEKVNPSRLPHIKGSLLLDTELARDTLHFVGIENYKTKRQLFWYQVSATDLFEQKN